MKSMPLNAISTALDSASIRHLVKLIAEFKSKHAVLVEDEIARFQYLCDSMFGTFTSRNKSGPDGAVIDWIPAAGNLDTGDSGFAPPPTVVDTFVDRRAVLAEMTRYVGPETEPALAESLAVFLVEHGFDLADQLPHLGVTVGCGTVNLFDAVCRDVVQQPLDTVLMPSIGYGFFLAQPYRAGGRVDVVDCDIEGRVRPGALAVRIAESNALLYRAWWPGRRHHVYTALRTAQQRGLFEVPGGDSGLEDLATSLSEHLSRDHVQGREELQKGVRALLPPTEGPTRDGRREMTCLVRPPEVRAFLHINPGVTGCLYSREAVEELGMVLAEAGVAAIEDLAYHSIRAEGSRVHSMQGRVPRCYTLFGVSKPFGLANVRIGLMLVAREDVKRVERLVENAVGFVPLVAQRTAAAALTADGDTARGYLNRASSDPDEGYETRLRLLLAMLRGVPGKRPEEYGSIERRICNQALSLLTAKRAAGTDVTGSAELDAHIVHDFVADGLSRWLTLPYVPEAGFFTVVSCRPLLESGLLQKLGMENPCAFDVFALLARALGVRTIPEEGMRPAHSRTHLLRMAFSPSPKVLIESLFTTYVSLRFLEQSQTTEVEA